MCIAQNNLTTPHPSALQRQPAQRKEHQKPHWTLARRRMASRKAITDTSLQRNHVEKPMAVTTQTRVALQSLCEQLALQQCTQLHNNDSKKSSWRTKPRRKPMNAIDSAVQESRYQQDIERHRNQLQVEKQSYEEQCELEQMKAEAERLMLTVMKEEMIQYIQNQSFFAEASLIEYIAATESSVQCTRKCSAGEFLAANPVYSTTWLEARRVVNAGSVQFQLNEKCSNICKDISQSATRHASALAALFNK